LTDHKSKKSGSRGGTNEGGAKTSSGGDGTTRKSNSQEEQQYEQMNLSIHLMRGFVSEMQHDVSRKVKEAEMSVKEVEEVRLKMC
jgi:TolA-binding protein